MIKVQFLGTSPIDYDGFPEKVARTFKGALHLKPKTVYELSAEEFEAIGKDRPELKFHVFKTEKEFKRPVVQSEVEVNLVKKVERKIVQTKKVSKSVDGKR